MDNISLNMVFTLSGFKELKANKYTYFVLILIAYLSIILFNLIVIVTIILERALHEPMYIFLCNLCFNGLYGSAGFYPKFLSDLINDVNFISYNGCLLQIFIIYSYGMCEYSTLMMMAYDRFVAICKPLEYHMKMTSQTIGRLILFSWSFPFLTVFGGIMLTSRMQLCGSHIDKLYCDNWSIVKLTCAPTTIINNVYGFFVILSAIAQGLFVVYSYIRLINACRKSKENKNKFMQTCVPHLLSLINFTIAILFDVMFSRYESRNFPKGLRDFLQLEFVIITPLSNPIIYGLKLTEIRKRVFRQYKEPKIKDSLHTKKR
ncbi:olfactory receptor 142-like [Anguilla anguilla]|uniref:olfactory receptor 142-like n=1 Tax=Anguilla anguilla TaxID=7936 RepID=UPI0015A94311|nr:olfactory receptor 142-like [Anguilla anguilla]XP_035288572.1 olfactory receptor 142-like [Anguilla anguilla]